MYTLKRTDEEAIMSKTIKRLPELFGSVDILKEAESYVSNDRSRNALERLGLIYGLLEKNGVVL